MDDWGQDAQRRLAAAGFRRGGARSAIVELLDGQQCALSAYEIEDELRAGGRTVARASVYRVLDELAGVGVLSRVEVGRDSARYEAARSDEHHHHHMVCDSCGEVAPFADAALERAVRRLARRVSFEVSEHDIVLRGACPDCRAASAPLAGDEGAR